MPKSGDKPDGLARPFRVTDGRHFRLSSVDPGDTRRFDSKKRARARLERDIETLTELQEKLYAQDRWALLLVFQAMDAAGKDSTIKHVMSGVNPQGCQVFSFKAPSDEELDHDFLWRTTCRLPERGRIGIFNRSYYEEVLVVRVHPEILARQRLPAELVTRDIWKERFEDINAFERYLDRATASSSGSSSSTCPEEEQRQRFLDAARRAREELEVLARRRPGAPPLGRLHGGLRGRDPPHQLRRTRRGTSSPPTTSGSRAWWSSRRSSTPCRLSISRSRASSPTA